MPCSPDREFREILARYPAAVRPAGEPESLGGAGGLSGARLWRFRSATGPMVLRLWPPHGPGRPHLEQVHRWLHRAGDLGFIPVPIADRSGQTLQELAGEFWELVPWMPGSPETSRPPATARVRSAFTAMAAFHQRLAEGRRSGTSPGLEHRATELDRLIRGGFDAIERAIRPPGTSLAVEATRWLDLARPMAPRLLKPLREAAGRVVPLQPCLRDARPDHFLFEGDRVTGLVDFGAMGIDCVAGDLVRLIGEWLDGDPAARAEALDAYERIRPLDPDEASLIDAFAGSSALLIGEHWIRWHFVEGRHFDDPSAVTTGIARSLEHLRRLAYAGLTTGSAPDW